MGLQDKNGTYSGQSLEWSYALITWSMDIINSQLERPSF